MAREFNSSLPTLYNPRRSYCTSGKGDELSSIHSSPPTIFSFQPRTPSPPKTNSKFMPFLSQKTRKTKELEGLIISWLHEGYDVLCLSETIRKPDLPFVWKSRNQDIKPFLHYLPTENGERQLYFGPRYLISQLKLRFILLLSLLVRLPYIHQECTPS